MVIDTTAKRIWSETKANSFWSTYHQQEELLHCLVGNVMNCLFCYPICMVRIHSRKDNLLPDLLIMLQEEIVGKSSIVPMLVLDFDSMLGSKLLKSFLGLQGLLWTETCHVIYVSDIGEISDMDGKGMIPLIVGESVLELGKETYLCADHFHLIHQNAFTKLGGAKYGLVCSFWNSCHCTK